MTTSWSRMMHGHPLEAARANAGGALLALLAAGGGLWLWASAARGRWLGRMPSDIEILAGAAIVVTVTLADWAWRLASI